MVRMGKESRKHRTVTEKLKERSASLVRECEVTHHQGEVGGAKLWSHFHWTPLNLPRGGQKPSTSNQGSQCIMPPARRPNTTEFKGVTYFPRDELINYVCSGNRKQRSFSFVLIGHFRVPKIVTFKMRPSAQPFLWKRVLFAWEWKIISISKAEHLTSFWYRGPGKLGNGLLPV